MHYIYDQMVPEGATVAESEFIKERDSDSEREVDILIEHEVAGTKLRIAVEFRDRSRRDSIEWVDNLIGKFRDLDVHKVIAVNRVGFSEEAVQKASANGIDTRTLEKALDTDWSKEFVKLGILKLTHRPYLVQVRIDTEPPLARQAELSYTIADQEGNVLGTLGDAVTDIFEQRIQPDVRQYIQEHFFDLFETVADLKRKVLVAERSLTIPIDLYLTDAVGEVYKIQTFYFHTVTVFSVDKSVVENYSYEKTLITSGIVESENSAATYSIDAVQIAGKEHGKVFIKQEKKEEK
jgi:hypothetical protein